MKSHILNHMTGQWDKWIPQHPPLVLHANFAAYAPSKHDGPAFGANPFKNRGQKLHVTLI